MPVDSSASSGVVYKLQKPDKLEDALKQDREYYDDCTPCRLLGSGAFIGLGAYTYFSGHYQLKQQQKLILQSGSRIGLGARQGMITALSAGLVILGIYRYKN